MTWPNFFIVGTMRAGTTSLHEYLNQIPNIYMSPVKEPHFFSIERVTEKSKFSPIRDEKKYLKLFEKVTNEEVIGEASPTYLQDSKAPLLIYEKSPNAKIVIILRDPVERAFSHYLLILSKGWETRNFFDVIKLPLNDDALTNIIEGGMYYEQVKRYLDIFGPSSVKIFFFESFAKDPKKTVNDILCFLGISGEFFISESNFNAFAKPKGKIAQFLLSNNTIRKLGNRFISSSTRLKFREKFLLTKIPKPTMKENERDFLRQLYKADVKNLEKLLNRKPSWKNFC